MSDLLDGLNGHPADRYAIEREFGRGGVARVSLAHDIKHDRSKSSTVSELLSVSTAGSRP